VMRPLQVLPRGRELFGLADIALHHHAPHPSAEPRRYTLPSRPVIVNAQGQSLPSVFVDLVALA
jgi:hypothetical protein